MSPNTPTSRIVVLPKNKAYIKRKPIKRVNVSLRKKPAAKRKFKPRTVTSKKKELDAIFSRYIRLRDGGKCYTCPKVGEIKAMQNGHFIPRQYLATRYDEVNNHCQCYACNMLYNGQPGAYATRLERDYGKGTVEMLEEKRKLTMLDFPYEYWIEIYKEKVAAYGV